MFIEQTLPIPRRLTIPHDRWNDDPRYRRWPRPADAFPWPREDRPLPTEDSIKKIFEAIGIANSPQINLIDHDKGFVATLTVPGGQAEVAMSVSVSGTKTVIVRFDRKDMSDIRINVAGPIDTESVRADRHGPCLVITGNYVAAKPPTEVDIPVRNGE